MTDPILVTREEYWTILWMIFNVGWFHTVSVMFAAPHEREEYDSSDN